MHPGSKDTAGSDEETEVPGRCLNSLGGLWSWDLSPGIWLQGQLVTATWTKAKQASKSKHSKKCRKKENAFKKMTQGAMGAGDDAVCGKGTWVSPWHQRSFFEMLFGPSATG